MSAYILEKFCIISFLFSSITFNVNCGQPNSKETPMDDTTKSDPEKKDPEKKDPEKKDTQGNDTVKIQGCQDMIKMKAGSIVELKLEAVPGSGYQWLLKDPSQLLELLDADNLKFTTAETEKPTPGKSGHQILHFKAIKKGNETIKLEYKRTWEKEVTDNCVMKVEVN